MARSSGVRCDRSGMSAMAGGRSDDATRERWARPPRAAVLCPRRDAQRATQSGGLFNNAARANSARSTSDVSADIDRGPPPALGATGAPPPSPPPPPPGARACVRTSTLHHDATSFITPLQPPDNMHV
ncbi:hypothetical protein O0L34_g12505 [Tuta absoluta]|nr:hypothetical protein O0L34_g12505 [Tuta absoluta]